MNHGQNHIDGYEVPIHSSLVAAILMGGVPKPFALCNLTVSAILTLGLGVWWVGVPIGLTLHSVATALTNSDPLWFEVGRRHVKHQLNNRYLEA